MLSFCQKFSIPLSGILFLLLVFVYYDAKYQNGSDTLQMTNRLNNSIYLMKPMFDDYVYPKLRKIKEQENSHMEENVELNELIETKQIDGILQESIVVSFHDKIVIYPMNENEKNEWFSMDPELKRKKIDLIINDAKRQQNIFSVMEIVSDKKESISETPEDI